MEHTTARSILRPVGRKHLLRNNWVRQREILLLTDILLFGLVLRLYGIRFGLPYLYHFDETIYVGHALNIGAGILNSEHSTPTGFINILFIVDVLYFLIGKLVGLFPDTFSFGESYKTDPSNIILLARLTSALFGTLTLLVMYKIGQSWKSFRAGFLAALIMSTAFLSVRDSHFGVPDSTLTFFVLISIMFCVLSLKNRTREFAPLVGKIDRRIIFLWLAFFSGSYALMVKWTVWLLAVPLLLTLYEHWRQKSSWTVANRVKILFIGSLLAALLGFILGGFQILLSPASYVDFAVYELSADQSGGFRIWQVDTLPGWLFYIKMMFLGFGILPGFLILLAIPTSIVRGWSSNAKLTLIIFSFPILYFLWMGATRHYFARYLLPVIPFAVLSLVDFLLWVKNRLEVRNPKTAELILALMTIVLLVQPIAFSLRLGHLLSKEDTRTRAHEWIEDNLNNGSRIAVDVPFLSPPLSTAVRKIPNSSKTYFVRDFSGQCGLSARDLDWYRQQSFDYLIASSFIYNIPLNDPIENQARNGFYHSLNEELELVQVFTPSFREVEPSFVFDEIYAPLVSLWERDQPGPVLKVYRIH